MKINVLFFDLDDTLFPAEAVYQLGLTAAWSALRPSHPMSWKRFQAIYERARGDVKAQLGAVPSARNRILYFKRFVEILEGHSDPALVLKLMSAYNTCWRHIDSSPVRGLLERLSRKFRLGVVTNQLAGFQLEKMNRIDPHGRFFKCLVTSEEVGCEKPDRRFFKAACRMARCRPEEAIVIGDSWTADILGARRAGLRAIYIHPGPFSKSLPRGVLRASSLEDIEKTVVEFSAR